MRHAPTRPHTQNDPHSSVPTFTTLLPPPLTPTHHQFNVWLLFRNLVDVILAYDLAAYMAFCFKYCTFPEEFSFSLVLGYAVGIFLCGFTYWAKVRTLVARVCQSAGIGAAKTVCEWSGQ